MEEILKSIKDELTCIRVKLEDLSAKWDEKEAAPALPPDETKITDCGFSNRTVHALERVEINNLGQLRQLTVRDIRMIRNIGSLCMKEIQKVL